MTTTPSKGTSLGKASTYSQELLSHLAVCETCWTDTIDAMPHRLARLKLLH